MELFLNLGKQFRRYCFKMILFLALAAILFSRPEPYGQIRKLELHLYEINWNHLCNFGRGHYGKYLCKIIFNLDQKFRSRCPFFKLFYYFLLWMAIF